MNYDICYNINELLDKDEGSSLKISTLKIVHLKTVQLIINKEYLHRTVADRQPEHF